MESENVVTLEDIIRGPLIRDYGGRNLVFNCMEAIDTHVFPQLLVVYGAFTELIKGLEGQDLHKIDDHLQVMRSAMIMLARIQEEARIILSGKYRGAEGTA